MISDMLYIGDTQIILNMRKITNGEAVERISKKHPHLDCSQVKYNGAFEKIVVRCTIHDHTFETPYKYIVSKRSKTGCIYCQRDSYRLNNETVIFRFIKTHGKKYDYNKVQYKSNLKKVEIVCPKHGSFMQEPANHWNGHGCMRCAVENGRHGVGGYTEETLKESNETGVVYVLKIKDGKIYYKIGISKFGGDKRIKDISYSDKAEVLYESKRILLKDAFRIEQEMLSQHNRYRHSHKKISGWTEIIDERPNIKLLEKKINSINYATI